jgi:hypothetical protein
MNTMLKAVGVFMVYMVFSYIIASWAFASFDVTIWPAEAREIFVFANFFAGLMVTGMIVSTGSSKD